MPRVPRIDQRVATNPLGRPSVPAAAFIPPDPVTPVDLSGVARLATDMYERERDKVDQVVILEIDNELARLSTDLRSRALERRGKDALGVSEEIGAEWQKEVSKIEGRARTDRQMLAFRERAMARGSSLYESVERHANAEWRTYEDSETEAALANRVTDAIENYAVPEKLRTAVTEARGIASEKARRNGFAPDSQTYIDTVTKAVTAVHAGAISQMVADGNDQLALRYFTEIKGELDGAVLPEITRRLEVVSSEGEGARGADAVWKELGPKSLNDPVKLATLEQAIRDRYGDNQSVIKAAIGQLRTRAEAFNSEQREVGASNEATVLGAYNEGRSLSQIMRMGEYLALPGDKQNSIRTYIVDRGYTLSQRAAADTPSERNWTKYWEVSNPQTLSGMSEAEIIALQPNLGRTLVTDLLEKRRGLAKSAANVRTATIDSDTFNTVAAAAGYTAYNANTRNAKAALGALKHRVETEIERVQQASGREMTRDEKRTLMESVVDDAVFVDSRRGPKSVRIVDVRDDNRGRTFVPWDVIPEEDRTQVAEALRAMSGRVPSKGQVQRAYAAWQLDDQARFRAIAGEGR